MIETGKNLDSRLNFAIWLGLISLALITGILLFSLEKNRYLLKLEKERRSVETILDRHNFFYWSIFSGGPKENARDYLRQITAHEKILGASVYDSDGNLIAQNPNNMRYGFREPGFPSDLSSIRDSKATSGIGRFAFLIKPFAYQEGNLHIVAVYSVEQFERDFANAVAVWIFAIAAVVLFAFFAIRIFLERTVTGPARKLAEAVRPFAGQGAPAAALTKDENELEAAIRWFKFATEENARMKRELVHLNTAMEEKVRERTRQSDEANRAKTAFLANMSHELRTPLNAILGFTNIISKKRGLSEGVIEQLTIIRRCGEYLLLLINDVLDLSKIESGQVELNEGPVELQRFLWELENMFKTKAAEKKLELSFELDENLPRYIKADELKLRQIITNLIDNAVKFTSEGGMRLRVRVADRLEENLSSDAETAVCFEVEDSGPGISPREMKDLFKAFVQTGSGHRSGQGSGLGLAISCQLVKMMNGEIKVESNLGKGSKFSFKIPLRTACFE